MSSESSLGQFVSPEQAIAVIRQSADIDDLPEAVRRTKLATDELTKRFGTGLTCLPVPQRRDCLAAVSAVLTMIDDHFGDRAEQSTDVDVTTRLLEPGRDDDTLHTRQHQLRSFVEVMQGELMY
jgi:hypothetical protein